MAESRERAGSPAGTRQRYAGTLRVAADQATGRGVGGVVLAAAPLAAAVGAELMRGGGNAYDAAVAAALAETVLLPSKCGLAGDVVALRVRPGAVVPEGLVAVGHAPARLAEEAAARGLAVTGPNSVGVPGAPAGYAALAVDAHYGLDRLAAPAIRLARDGFVWASINATLAAESVHVVRANNPDGGRYFPDWQPLAPGSLVQLPGMADLLEEFTARGAELFVGPVGQEVARSVTERGGIIGLDDFAPVRVEWEAAPHADVLDRRLWATPAPTHGPALLRAMTGDAPTNTVRSVWDRVQAGRAALSQLADGSGTSIVSAADAAGNVVTVVHSNSFPRFGSGLLVPRYDLILNNRPGRGFTSEPGHPNFPAPGRRPVTTLHAWAISHAGGTPALLGGTPGGDNQLPWNVQLLSQHLAGEADLGMLVVAPRWALESDGSVVVEDPCEPEDVAELQARAPRVARVEQWGLRSAQQVIAVPRPGSVLVGAVDPRTGGAAIPV